MDARDAIPNNTVADVHEALRSGIRTKLQAGLTTLVILFHDLDAQTYPPANLKGHIALIDSTIRSFILSEEKDKEEQTQFVPDWSLTTAQIRTELLAKDWVTNDPRH